MPGFIGLPELILLGLVALILFGPKRLPEMGRGLGKGLREFKSSITGEERDEHGFDESKLELPTEQRKAA
jgi:sec-independent protein translocase protein TatA